MSQKKIRKEKKRKLEELKMKKRPMSTRTESGKDKK